MPHSGNSASLSKPVFSYAVPKLADAGRIDLDAPVAKYLPGDYVEDPRLRSITARRVLSHTTGFPNWRPQGQPLKIHFEPGERFSYSGEGFVYLQKAVENLTGQTLEALTRRPVFEPMRMTNHQLHLAGPLRRAQSLALNPANTNATDQLRKLKTPHPSN